LAAFWLTGTKQRASQPQFAFQIRTPTETIAIQKS
jgi:hypothetical protein